MIVIIKMNDFLKEKELLLDSIENNTSEHWKNYYKDVPAECIYDDLVIDINEIKRLQNNWNELKSRLQERIKFFAECDKELILSSYKKEIRTLKVVLDDMQELEQVKDE